MKIGLLGGSFNPAHEGHIHLSKEALARLKLDQVWWLVSPKNPLKNKEDIAEYDLRVKVAQKVAKNDLKIKIVEIEAQQGLYYTVDTLKFLKKAYPKERFVWLMGADNLAQFDRWKGWQEIFSLVPIAVFDRAPSTQDALGSKASLAFADSRRSPSRLRRKTPSWCYCYIPLHPESSTRLRNKLGKAAFLRHT